MGDRRISICNYMLNVGTYSLLNRTESQGHWGSAFDSQLLVPHSPLRTAKARSAVVPEWL